MLPPVLGECKIVRGEVWSKAVQIIFGKTGEFSIETLQTDLEIFELINDKYWLVLQ